MLCALGVVSGPFVSQWSISMPSRRSCAYHFYLEFCSSVLNFNYRNLQSFNYKSFLLHYSSLQKMFSIPSSSSRVSNCERRNNRMLKSVIKPIHYRPSTNHNIRFSKLFMSHLDAEFHKQNSPDLKNLVADQVSCKRCLESR